MDDLADLGAAASAKAIRDGACTSEALVATCLARIDDIEPRVRAFVDLDPGRAIDEARTRDRAAPADRGLLHGVPVAIKELFDVAGHLVTWGTPIHTGRVATGDADLVTRLRASGAVIFGTTVSTEYAVAAAGPTTNPFDAGRTPGGSSSGSAAAVGAGMVPLAIGSQTIGSVVRPAVYCGVFGLKPTRGAISSRGAMALAPSLDHPGPIARTADDLALACRVLFAPDPADPPAIMPEQPDHIEAPPGLRVLMTEGPLGHRIEEPSRQAMNRAAAALEEAGVPVEKENLPDAFDQAEACILTIFEFEVARQHGADRDRAGEHMSQRMRDIIDRGRAIDEDAYVAARRQSSDLTARLEAFLSGDTVLLSAAVDSYAPPITDEGTGANNLQGLPTLCGAPSVAVPCGLVDGLPVGVQIYAAPGRDALILAAARLAATA